MPWPFTKSQSQSRDTPSPSSSSSSRRGATPPPASSSSLPPGNPGSSLVGNTFSFHSNAQALVLETTRKHPGSGIVRARVLNQDVALVVDHEIATGVLDPNRRPLPSSSGRSSHTSTPSSAVPAVGADGGRTSDSTPSARFSHREAYKQLLAAFFSEPNILLEDEDEPDRPAHRAQWDEHMSSFLAETWEAELVPALRAIVRGYGDRWTWSSGTTNTPTASATDESIELYSSLKELSHRLVFALFLGLTDPEDEEYQVALRTTDTSLRGQFSLPVRFGGLGGWGTSPFSKGLKAQAEFNDLVSSRVQSGQCPFLHTRSNDSGPHPPASDHSTSTGTRSGGVDGTAAAITEDQASHLSMFSSSLVIKALASYLTFAILQRSRHPQGSTDHLLLETERLCPPIIGVLRRLTNGPWTVDTDDPDKMYQIPEGWDVWLYFPMINRDPRVYGADARLFRADRWEAPQGGGRRMPEPLSHGLGAKRCLGLGLVRRLVRLVVDELMEGRKVEVVSGLEGSLADFLGWEVGGDKEEEWEGVKQLPVQRPRGEIRVRFERG